MRPDSGSSLVPRPCHGTFICWPDGPLGEPMRLEHPLWNKGVVAQNEMRPLVHWNAELYNDLDEVKASMNPSEDLTHDVVFERLLADLRARGIKVAEPTDLLHDKEFIRALIDAYSITPTTDWADHSA